jgi:hypothetical protein
VREGLCASSVQKTRVDLPNGSGLAAPHAPSLGACGEFEVHLPRSRVRRTRNIYNLIYIELQIAIMYSSPVVPNLASYYRDRRSSLTFSRPTFVKTNPFFKNTSYMSSAKVDATIMGHCQRSEHGTHRLPCIHLSHYTTIDVTHFQIEFITTKKLLFENLIIALQKSPSICF